MGERGFTSFSHHPSNLCPIIFKKDSNISSIPCSYRDATHHILFAFNTCPAHKCTRLQSGNSMRSSIRMDQTHLDIEVEGGIIHTWPLQSQVNKLDSQMVLIAIHALLFILTCPHSSRSVRSYAPSQSHVFGYFPALQ